MCRHHECCLGNRDLRKSASLDRVVHELLTGKQFFHAEIASDTIVAVLARDPDLSDVPSRFGKASATVA